MATRRKEVKNWDRTEPSQADVTLSRRQAAGDGGLTPAVGLRWRVAKIYATIVWSSPYYDYMMVEDETYYNEAEAGENSTFTIPLEKLPCEISVIGDTTAMSVPHEIEYTLSFTLKETDFSELTKTGSGISLMPRSTRWSSTGSMI